MSTAITRGLLGRGQQLGKARHDPQPGLAAGRTHERREPAAEQPSTPASQISRPGAHAATLAQRLRRRYGCVGRPP